MLNAAVAAFAHRAIEERDLDVLAAEALSYLAAGLQAESAELFVLSADGTALELAQRFPEPRETAPESLPVRGSSLPAEAYRRGGVVVRGNAAAAAVATDRERACVFVVHTNAPLVEPQQFALDVVAATYAAAMSRNAAEGQLAERTSRLRLILDRIPAIVTTLDTDLVFTSARGAALANVPAESAALVGRSFAEIVGGDSLLPVVTARRVLAGIPSQFEWTWAGRTYENRMEPLRDRDGRIVGVINLGIDVTDKLRAEEELRGSREELRRLSAAMNQIQENQRRRIAREIHDDLGQRLTALRLELGLMRSDVHDGHTGEAEARTTSMIELVDDTLTTARRLAMELRPAVLDDFGFAAAVEHEVESFARRTGIEVALSIEPPDIAIEPARATAIFRVVQEALTNVARHAGASRVEVRVQRREDRVEAEVRDNGRGITEDELHNAHALGLIGIRERVFAFDGTVIIERDESGRNESGGTRVYVSVPDEDPDRG